MKRGAHVWEIYSAIQGEGLCLGERHVFLRLAGCNLDCCFCDTRARRGRAETCAVERTPGEGDFEPHRNPLGWEETVEAVLRLARGAPPASRVSFTGGEPLLEPAFVESVAAAVSAEGIGTYLETNGTLPDALARVRRLMDWVAMDVKLPSSSRCGDYWEEHREFLRIASGGRVFVKAVITPDSTEEDVLLAARMVADVDRTIPVVLQPATPARDVREPVSPRRLRVHETIARKVLDNVRVLPQVHRILGER